MKTYTIGQLAKAAEVPTSTVRYYERRGLVAPMARSSGNYRLFDNEALDRLRFIRSAQAAGFTLADITELLSLKEDQAAPCQEVQELIVARLDEVVEKIEHLQAVDGMLRRWLEVCQSDQPTGQCSVIAGLESSTRGKLEKTGKTT